MPSSSFRCDPTNYTYTKFYVPSFDDPDFVCTQSTNNGMQPCSNIPALKHDTSGRSCTLSCDQKGMSNYSNNCVNWNGYYNQCRLEGDNPFWGAIGFDNIFLAWVAIFQVSTKIAGLKRNPPKNI